LSDLLERRAQDFADANDMAGELAARGGMPGDGNPLPAFDQMVWGGFLQQSGFPRGSLTGQRLTFGRMVYYYQLSKQRIFEGAYAGFSLEAGYLGGPLVPGGTAGALRSGALFLGVDTPVGPVYLGYGYARGGRSAMYFYLGKP
jgi:NTE family protein